MKVNVQKNKVPKKKEENTTEKKNQFQVKMIIQIYKYIMIFKKTTTTKLLN